MTANNILQERTLAELAQGATGIAKLKIYEQWQRGIVFESGEDRFFGFFIPDASGEKVEFTVCRFRILNNGVKVGNPVMWIPATELKALLSEAQNG